MLTHPLLRESVAATSVSARRSRTATCSHVSQIEHLLELPGSSDLAVRLFPSTSPVELRLMHDQPIRASRRRPERRCPA